MKCLYTSSWANTGEDKDREPGKEKTFAIYANYNSKEERIEPSSNQRRTSVFEGMSVTAYACINQDFMHGHGSLAVCHAEAALQANLLT